jgi:hypothetical protein
MYAPAKDYGNMGDAYQGNNASVSVFSGALVSGQFVSRDEPSTLTVSTSCVALVGTRCADRRCGGLIRL